LWVAAGEEVGGASTRDLALPIADACDVADLALFMEGSSLGDEDEVWRLVFDEPLRVSAQGVDEVGGRLFGVLWEQGGVDLMLLEGAAPEVGGAGEVMEGEHGVGGELGSGVELEEGRDGVGLVVGVSDGEAERDVSGPAGFGPEEGGLGAGVEQGDGLDGQLARDEARVWL
jgi:hypothetical protein